MRTVRKRGEDGWDWVYGKAGNTKPEPVEDTAQAVVTFEQVDAMTVADAAKALVGVGDVELLHRLVAEARLKGTARAAKERLRQVV